jgi:CxxC motif-containing protein (DUF1111 family)
MNKHSSHRFSWMAGASWTAASVMAWAPGCSQGASPEVESNQTEQPNVSAVSTTAGGRGGSSGGHGGSSSSSGGAVVQQVAVLVSGTILGSNGEPLSGVTVALFEGGAPTSSGAQADNTAANATMTTTTDVAGYYSFAVDGSGTSASVSIRPSESGTTFTPSVQNLDSISENTTANFTASTPGAAVTVAFDPGPRTGTAGAGVFPALASTNPTCVPGSASNNCPLPSATTCVSSSSAITPAANLQAANLAFCENAFVRFQETDSVSGTIVDGPNPGSGLGPTFNGNSCAQCHSQPAVGGSSPGMTSPQHPVPNPQIALATLDGATNSLTTLTAASAIPSTFENTPFITTASPVREVRFASDGGVHGLFSIAGRKDASGCTASIEPQPAAQNSGTTVSFRIPTPIFGLGLVENVTDNALKANLDSAPSGAPSSESLGITGFFNTSGNDGTITRFGWKAQNKSLLIFSGEAYNVEMGVSNENFPDERAVESAACVFNGGPEDATNTIGPISGTTTGTASDMSSDITDFAAAMRFSAPPAPATGSFVAGGTTITANEVATGKSEFISIGCGNCHSPSLKTEASGLDPAMSNVTFSPFSDFAVHDMGTGLADVATQGGAGPQDFRSAPLWGVGQRLFFLHDGRATSLVTAIQDHSSSGSEANTVIASFNKLSVANQQAIVDFLRSL